MLISVGATICLAVENRQEKIGQVHFFDIRSGPKPSQTISTGKYTSDVSTLGFSPDDIYLAIGSSIDGI